MEYTDPLDAIPENRKCPICVQIPKNKVFQCQNSHILCEECFTKVNEECKRNEMSPCCPHCRVPFGDTPIRNMGVEEILDDLISECPYKQAGCNSPVNRKTFEEHLLSCRFGVGPPINVCKALGFQNCNFTMHRGNTADGIEHFKTSHQSQYSHSNIFKLNFSTFDSFQEGEGIFTILDRKDDGFAFLILATAKTEKDKKFVTWNTFYWKYPSGNNFSALEYPIPYQVECSLQGEHSLIWRVPPIDILKSEDQTPPTYYMDMPAHLFVKRDSGDLSLQIEVVKQLVT